MKRHLMTFVAAGALTAGMMFAQTAPAQPSQGSRPVHSMRQAMARRHMKMMQALNLTDAQKQQAKSIFQQERATAKPIRDQLRQNRQALAAAVKANDAAKIQQITATQGKLRGQFMADRAEAMAKFYQTLTPEQRAKADQMHQQHRRPGTNASSPTRG